MAALPPISPWGDYHVGLLSLTWFKGRGSPRLQGVEGTLVPRPVLLGLSEFTTVVSVLWLGPEWVGRSGQSTTDPAVVRHIWGKIRAED